MKCHFVNNSCTLGLNPLKVFQDSKIHFNELWYRLRVPGSQRHILTQKSLKCPPPGIRTRRILREMADCKQSTEDRSTYCTFSTFSGIKISPKEEMEAYFKLEQKKYIIQISLGSSLFSFNQRMVSSLKMSFLNKKQKVSTKARTEP